MGNQEIITYRKCKTKPQINVKQLHMIHKASLDEFMENCVLEQCSPNKNKMKKQQSPKKPLGNRCNEDNICNNVSNCNNASYNHETVYYVNKQRLASNNNEKQIINLNFVSNQSSRLLIRESSQWDDKQKQNPASASVLSRKITIKSITKQIQTNQITKMVEFKESMQYEEMRGLYGNSDNQKKRKIQIVELDLPQYYKQIINEPMTKKKVNVIDLPVIQKQDESIDMQCNGLPCFSAINQIKNKFNS